MLELYKEICKKQDGFINYLLKYLPGTSKRIEIFKGDIASLKQQIEQEELDAGWKELENSGLDKPFEQEEKTVNNEIWTNNINAPDFPDIG